VVKDGFYHIKLDENCTKYFSFATADGQYEFLRLPFGFCESPAEFQKRLINILQVMIRKDKVLVYIDDILIPSETVDENLATLYDVLVILRRYNLEINIAKCSFVRRNIEYLGYSLNNGTIKPSDRHISAVKCFPQPTNVVELQRFLGLTNFFRRFIENYAEKAKPLHNLLRKMESFDFNFKCVQAFNMLKDALVTKPVLHLYNYKAETQLHTDASAIAVAAILLQKQQNHAFAPVAYYSQATNQAEHNYHSFELEMLAIVKAIERFHIYLYGIDFTVITDCHALVYAVNKAHVNPRIARWVIRLQNYTFKVLHREGSKMRHVDALSRIVALVNTMPLEKELQYRQLADRNLQKIVTKVTSNSENTRYRLIDGLLFRVYNDKPLFVVPESMVNQIIRLYHDELAHCGSDKTYYGITAHYWFPSVKKRITAYIKDCLVCILANSTSHAKEGELQLTEHPSEPFRIIHIDYFGPLTPSDQGHKHILLIVDAFTRFVWLFASKTTNAKEAKINLASLFSTFGNPDLLISDRGTAFASTEFAEFLRERNIDHRLVAVAAPWANGLVERVNRFLKSSMQKLLEIDEDWANQIGKIQAIINNTYHSSIQTTPSKLLLGYDLRNHADKKLQLFIEGCVPADLSREQLREANRQLAAQATNKIKAYNKAYYDLQHKKPTIYSVGDLVMIRDVTLKPGEERKFKARYKGPYKVVKILKKNRYVITDIPGFNVVPRPYNSILSTDKLKPWISVQPG